MNENDIQILNDQPIPNATLFNFDAYTEALGRIITRDKTETPLVIGIFGDWGSGKTSLMRTLEEKIKNDGDGFPAKTIWFNAWKYDKEEAIWRALLMRILEELKPAKGEKKTEEESKRDDELITKLKDLQNSLYKDVHREDLGEFTFDIGKAGKGFLKLGIEMLPYIRDIPQLIDKGQKDALTTLSEAVARKKIKTSIDKVQDMEQFQEKFQMIIDEYYLKNRKRAVIFIDDLDRCIPEKAIEVLEAIKLFLDVTGCIFVLGIDRRVISQGVKVKYRDFIKTEGGIPINGDEYLEKIIQLSFNLPPILDKNLQKFIKDNDLKEAYKDYHGMIINGIGRNPRKIKRFLNAIEFQRNLAEIIPEIRDDVKEDLKPSFDALLIEWQILSIVSDPDLVKFKKEVSENSDILIKMHNYVESQTDTIPEELKPFKKDSIIKLIEKFPRKGKLKEGGKEIIDKVIHLSSVTETKKSEDVESRGTKPLTRGDVNKAINAKKSLEGANLSEADLHGLNLNGMNFSYATLERAHLKGAHLAGADLTGAHLEGADLSEADLSNAILSNTFMIKTDLSRAILTGVNLTSFLHLKEAKFKGSDLSGVDFSHAELDNVDFTNTNNINNIIFLDSKLSGAKFKGLELSGVNFKDAVLKGSDFSHATLTNVDFSDADLTGADLPFVKFSKVNFKGTDFTRANFSEAIFDEETCLKAVLNEAKNLTGINLSRTNLSGFDLNGKDLTDAKLIGTNLVNANLDRTILSKVDISGADLSGATLMDTDLSGAKLVNSILNDIKTSGVKVDTSTNTKDVILVRKEDINNETMIVESLDKISDEFRKKILEDNESLQKIYYPIAKLKLSRNE